MPDTTAPTNLVVFADDWGRHPSSSQHLVRYLLPEMPTLWVNTIGTRKPRLSAGDVRRGVGKLRDWFGPAKPQAAVSEGLTIVSPRMCPGFRRDWQRRFNARQIANTIGRADVALTTLPITADLVGRLDVDRWVYYCVDDYSTWPGTDHAVMDAMERELVEKVDAIVCVSETLRERIKSMGQDSVLLTHGIDPDHWRAAPDWSPVLNVKRGEFFPAPTALFWGLLDERMDVDWCWDLQRAWEGTMVLAGPIDRTEPGLADVHRSAMVGPVSYEDLPSLAAAADVLVMPYIDAPVTRAMQPLKLKEYLGTGKPVVVRDLPATREWADCCDVVSTAEDFVRVCVERAKTGTPPAQVEARKRLADESWSEKARRLRAILLDESPSRR